MIKLKVSFVFILVILSLSSFLYAAGISDMEEMILKGNYTETISLGHRLLAADISLKQKRNIYYFMGLSYLKLGNTQKARSDFREVLDESKNILTVNSQIGIADSHFLDKDFYEARDKYEEILSAYRNLENKANVYFKLAQVSMKTGSFASAKKYLKKVKDDYPLSFEAPLACEILKENAFYFTVQVGSFSDKANAQRLLGRLKKKDYPAYINKRDMGSLTFYRVRIGKFEKESEALSLESRLKKEGLPTNIYP